MGQKTVRFSDLSGQLIMREDALARIVIHEHPDLGDGPVEIEALADEALGLEKDTLRVAVLDLYLPGEDLPRRVTMDADAFGGDGDREAGGRDAGRRAAGQARRAAAAGAGRGVTRRSCASVLRVQLTSVAGGNPVSYSLSYGGSPTERSRPHPGGLPSVPDAPSAPSAPSAPGALRASHADRDLVVEQLRVAAGDGRLSPEELDERLELALTARTYAELATLVADLPAAGTAVSPAPLSPTSLSPVVAPSPRRT